MASRRGPPWQLPAALLIVLVSCMDPDEPEPPSVPTDAIRLTQSVGATPGTLSAGLAGEARYEVPLSVPPGRAGMQPELALVYDSQRGNGPLGAGFALRGLTSAITRCVHRNDPASRGRVLMTAEDRFCLDGEPLVLFDQAPGYGAPGSQYRTEVESMRRIRALGSVHGAPERFVVEAENDRVLTYETRVMPERVRYDDPEEPEPIAEGVVTVQWSLTRIEDRDGNAIRFEYETELVGSAEVQGTAYYRHRPRAIVYTDAADLPAQKRIDLIYEARPDPRDAHVAGTRERVDYRLARIEMRGPTLTGENRLAWSYTLSYTEPSISGRSLLTTLQHCDAFGGCLPATRFSWERGSLGYRQVELPNLRAGLASTQLADVDGDGRDDMIVRSGRGNALVFRSNGEGLDLGAALATSGQLGAPPILVDVTGDGRSELVAPEVSSVCVTDIDCNNNQHCARVSPDGATGVCADACACTEGDVPRLLSPGETCPPDLVHTCRGETEDCANHDGREACWSPETLQNIGRACETAEQCLMGSTHGDYCTGTPGDPGVCITGCECFRPGIQYEPGAGRSCPNTSTCGTGFTCMNGDLDASAECMNEASVAGVGWQFHHFVTPGTAFHRGQLIPGPAELFGHGSITFADVDGDGDPDLLRRDAEGLWALGRNDQGLFRGDSGGPLATEPVFFDPRSADLQEHEYGAVVTLLDQDRDRRADVLIPIRGGAGLAPNVYTAVSVDDPTPRSTNLRADLRDIVLADVTGDGVADAVDLRLGRVVPAIWTQVNVDHGFGAANVAIDAASGFAPFLPQEVTYRASVCHRPTLPSDPPYCQEGSRDWWQADLRYRVADLNQDGRQDILGLGPTPTAYLASESPTSGLPVFHAQPLPFTFDDRLTTVEDLGATVTRRPPFLVGDLNGDGQVDFAYGRPRADGGREDLVLQLSREGRADLLTAVTDGLGAQDSVRYTTLADASVYDDSTDFSGDTACGFPYTCASRRMPVVAALQYANPGHEPRTITYRYRGARRDARSGQFLGFSRVLSRDEARGSERETWLDGTRESAPDAAALRWPYHPVVGRPTRTYEVTPIPARGDLPDEVHVTRTDVRYESESRGLDSASVHPEVAVGRQPRGLRVLLRDVLRRQHRITRTEWETEPTWCAGACDPSDHLLDVQSRTFAQAWRMDRTHLEYLPQAYSDGAWNVAGPVARHPVASAVSHAIYRGDTLDFGEVNWRSLDDEYETQIRFFERTVIEHEHRTEPWLLARPVRSEVARCDAVRTTSSGLECGDNPRTVRRHTRFEHYDTGRLHRIVREPEAPLEDDDGRPTGLTLTTEYTWDRGNIVEAVRRAADGAVRHERLSYDPVEQALPIAVRSFLDEDDALTHQLGWEPSLGALLAHRSPSGAESQFRYDGIGRLRGRRAPGAAWAEIDYSTGLSGAPFVTREHGAAVVESTALHDARMRVTDAITAPYRDAAPSSVQVGYDALGRVADLGLPAELTDSDRARFQQHYDPLDRPTRTDFVADRTASPNLEDEVAYRLEPPEDPFGAFSEVTAHRDALGHEHETWQGLTGWVDRTRDAVGTRWLETARAHDLRGEVEAVSRTGATGTTTSLAVLESDRLGRALRVVDADRGEVEVRYDAFDQPVWHRDADGRETRLTYDALGRPLTRINDLGAVRFQWDTAENGRGLLHTAYAADGTANGFAYDEHGRVVREEHEAGRYEYRYDAEGRLAAVIYPEATGGQFAVSYEHEGGYLARVRQGLDGTGPVLWEALRRDADGRVASERTGAGVVTERTYAPRSGRLATRVVRGPTGAILSDLRLTYLASGELETRQDIVRARTERFEHDDLGHLRLWSRTARGRERTVLYRYDDLGNLREVEEVGGSTEVLDYDQTGGAGPHAVTTFDGRDLAYDAAGRRTLGAHGETIAYDDNDLPTSIEAPGLRVRFRYDAFGRRIESDQVGRGGRRRVRAAGDLYERRDSAGGTQHVFTVIGAEGAIAQVSRGGGDPGTRYLHAGELGSITFTTDGAGTAVDDVWLSPFGRRIEADGRLAPLPARAHEDLTLGFTGHEHDWMLGMIDMRGRVYDVATHSFLTPDPIVGAPHLSDGWNRYSYVRNNPLNLVDPSGFESVPVIMGDTIFVTGDPGTPAPGPLDVPGNPYPGGGGGEPLGWLGLQALDRIVEPAASFTSSLAGGSGDGFSGAVSTASAWANGAAEIGSAFAAGAGDAVSGMLSGLGEAVMALPFSPQSILYRGYLAYEAAAAGNYLEAAGEVASMHPAVAIGRMVTEAGFGIADMVGQTVDTLQNGGSTEIASMAGGLAVFVGVAFVTKRVGAGGLAATRTLTLFNRLGIRTTRHFRNRLLQRARRGITESNALDAYQNGRLFYNEATRNYIRHSSRTGVSVVTDAPSGGRAISVFEGAPSPDWVPVRWRPGM